MKMNKLSRIKMSFDEYDTLIEQWKEKDPHPEWPDTNSIKELEENDNPAYKSKDRILFCCYITEFAPEPISENDKEAKKMLLDILNKYLILEESNEEH